MESSERWCVVAMRDRPVGLHADCDLSQFSRYRTGGRVDTLFEPVDEAALVAGLRDFREREWDIHVIGEGTNCLFPDSGLKGVLVRLSEPGFREIAVEGDRLFVGAGVQNHALAAYARKHGIKGFEFLAGFPGSIGGGIFGNAGEKDQSFGDILVAVKGVAFDDAPFCWERGEFTCTYRSFPALTGKIVTGAWFECIPGDSEEIAQQMADIRSRRKENEPRGQSCGSVFKNPYPDRAWELLEAVGLRGHKEGGARFSETHPNWIVTEPDATSHDVLQLIKLAKEKVFLSRGIELELEVRLLGEF